MALSYRSTLTTAAADPVDMICNLLDERGQPYERHTDPGTGICRIALDSELESDAGVVVTVVPSGNTASVLIERRHPLVVNETTPTESPSFIPELLERLDPWTGQLPVAKMLHQDELERWFSIPDAVGAAVVILASDDAAVPTSLVDTLRRHLGGMAGVGRASTGAIERLIAPLERSANLREGGVIYLERGKSAATSDYLPATVTRRQTESTVRRLRRRALAWQAKSRFETSVELRLEAFGRARAFTHPSSDWFEEKESLEGRLALSEDERETSLLEHEETLRELDGVRSRLAYVERKLAEYGAVPIIEMADELDDIQPSSCLEAIQYAREYLTFLEISAQEEPILRLDGYDKCVVWRTKIWSALVALNSYATFRAEERFSGNFLQFCDDPPAGARAFFANGIALKESDSTAQNRHAREARTFRVPTTVNSDLRAYMEAHVKIDQRGMPAPRIHFLDDTAHSKRIYVGYVGPHLPTGAS